MEQNVYYKDQKLVVGTLRRHIQYRWSERKQ